MWIPERWHGCEHTWVASEDHDTLSHTPRRIREDCWREWIDLDVLREAHSPVGAYLDGGCRSDQLRRQLGNDLAVGIVRQNKEQRYRNAVESDRNIAQRGRQRDGHCLQQ